MVTNPCRGSSSYSDEKSLYFAGFIVSLFGRPTIVTLGLVISPSWLWLIGSNCVVVVDGSCAVGGSRLHFLSK